MLQMPCNIPVHQLERWLGLSACTGRVLLKLQIAVMRIIANTQQPCRKILCEAGKGKLVMTALDRFSRGCLQVRYHGREGLGEADL